MATKSEMLRVLEQKRGEVVSGEELAARLQVSRAAVWKAAQALRGQGHDIRSVQGSGYVLAARSDRLTPEALEVYLPPDTPVRVVACTASTNTLAKAWAAEGAPHGAVVMAERQESGRGRMGRSFESPPGGVYMSVVLRPDAGESNPALATAAAAVAVCRAVQALCGIRLGIKWVNDLYLGGKKCCGILCEASTGLESGRMEYIVAGIGINYSTNEQAFSQEVRDVVTSLYPDGGGPVTRAQLAARVHRELLRVFAELSGKEYLDEYRAHSIVVGRQVQVMSEPPYMAKAEGIDDEARLVVRAEDGKQAVLSSGEIRIQL